MSRAKPKGGAKAAARGGISRRRFLRSAGAGAGAALLSSSPAGYIFVREAVAAVRRGAKVVFVSPVFATRSHPEADGLGPRKARRIAQGLPVTVIALGGMDARRFRKLTGFSGWAAIDAWSSRSSGAK